MVIIFLTEEKKNTVNHNLVDNARILSPIEET